MSTILSLPKTEYPSPKKSALNIHIKDKTYFESFLLLVRLCNLWILKAHVMYSQLIKLQTTLK
jgi:hypothetical protein